MTDIQDFTNHLITEGSPYLLMHAHNPVDWHPWNDEAWTKATKEDKLVVISIGYAACHWCHVMEHESFSDGKVAQIMNKDFVSIKVDREERPDVDQVYMDIAQQLNGTGGWPLNIITLSNGKPVFAGTYFKKAEWIFVLKQLNQLYYNQRDELILMADNITNAVNDGGLQNKLSVEPSEYDKDVLFRLVNSWEKLFDYEYGGFKSTPKFPLPSVYEFLLAYNNLSSKAKIPDSIKVTLDKMALGGIYDQIGGGFARYSTDRYWKVPHFEKMLYDNAQLVSLYAKAYQLTKTEHYKTVVEETLQFVQKELTSSEYGFYSSLDADSEGKEGEYYTWMFADIASIAKDDLELVAKYFNLSQKGNWEDGKNILYRNDSDESFSKEQDITIAQLQEKLSKIKIAMLIQRNKRVKPALDNKILTAWNALMLHGHIDAYKATGNIEYLSIAKQNARFIATKAMSDDGKLTRNYMNGKPSINAFLDDYAYTIRTFMALYQVTFDKQWILNALRLTGYAIKHFYDKESGLFFYTSDIDQKLIVRKMELFDGVIPGSNSIMAINLFVLGELMESEYFHNLSEGMLKQMVNKLTQAGPYASYWLQLMIYFIDPPAFIAVVGKNCFEESRELQKIYLPNTFIVGGSNEEDIPYLNNKLIADKTTFYLCRNRTCGLPVDTEEGIIAQLSGE